MKLTPRTHFHKHLLLGMFLICLWMCSPFGILGCSGDATSKQNEKTHAGKQSAVQIVYVDWASERASANVVKAVLQQKMDRPCELLSVTLIAMWQSIAAGDQDAMVAAWLPSLQDRYLEKYKSQVDYLGKNLKGTSIGLVVPEYVSIESIQELKRSPERFENKIIGIDPHAGLMEKTAQAMQVYSLKQFKLVSGSGSTMTTALRKAIEQRRWIVVTGWSPHWKFAKWDLKYLQDPKNVYGDEEYIGTVARKGLARDLPKVYSFLDSFSWTPKDMQQVMLWAQDPKTSYFEAAKRWVRKNEELVKGWLGDDS